MDRPTVSALVALGANLGNARKTLETAIEALARLPQTRLVKPSRLYRSAPYEASGPDFINAVVRLDTRLTAHALLDALLALENAAGRQRPYVNAPRTLDLDLLFYGDARIQSPRLTVPHPRLYERAFVLLPLADVAPERVSEADLAAVQSQDICLLDGT